VSVVGGAALLAWARDGTLLYGMGSPRQADAIVVRVDRNGVVTPVDTSMYGAFNAIAVSPDGARLAIGGGSTSGGLNIFIKQLDHGPMSRFTFSGGDRRPAWSPDGRQLAFIRDSAGGSAVTVKPADGSTNEHRVAKLDRIVQEVTWSRDGQWLIVRTDNATVGAGDILAIRADGTGSPVPLAATPFTELMPTLSPDGRWLAYVSNESGRNEIYVRPFPDASRARYEISTTGGDEPRWSADGHELFFIDPGNRMNAAAVRTSPDFAVTQFRPLFSTAGFIRVGFHQTYDVTRDGRFFFTQFAQAGGGAALTLVQVRGWFEDLKARLRP
jgi:Tol biopolymer transport system component